ncbi:MAG: DUF2917 domain-containing protein [Caldimonas sp.]
MKIEFSASGVVLAKDQLIRLPRAEGVRIASRRGSVWITQDGDLRDVVLQPGESLVLGRDTPAIVQAFEPALITIAEPARRRDAGHVMLRKLRDAIGRLAGAPAWA